MGFSKRGHIAVFLLVAILIMGALVVFTSPPQFLTGAIVTSLDQNITQNLSATPQEEQNQTQLNTTTKPVQEELPEQEETESIPLEIAEPPPLETQDVLTLNDQIANASQCGVVNNDLTLTQNIQDNATCLTLNASNIVIDCDSNSITFGSNATNDYGIHVDAQSNISVLNCRVYENNLSQSAEEAIYISGSPDNVTIAFTQIHTTGNQSRGVFATGSNITLTNLFINTSGNVSSAITTQGVDSFNITHVNITTTGYSSKGIRLTSTSNNGYLAYNNINTTGEDSYGIRITTLSHSNTLESNDITTTGANAHPLYLTTLAEENRIINNNFTGSGYAILDSTGNSYNNYLIYNTTQGEIIWTNTTSGGFLKDLTIIGSIGLGKGIEFADKVVAINTTKFSASKINSSANITIRNATYINISNIFTTQDFTTNASQVAATGIDCLGSTCQNISYTLTTFIFNTSHTGTFTVNGSINNTAPNTTFITLNTTFDLNKTNQDLYCFATLQDQDQETLTANWAWYNSSQLYSSGTTTVTNTTLTNIANLSSTLTRGNHNWTCSVYASDNIESELDTNNDTLTIVDSLPTTANLLVNATSISNSSSDDIYCYVNAIDQENATLAAHWIWYNDSVLHSSGTTQVTNATPSLVATIASSVTSPSQNWTCQTQIEDETNNETTANNASIIITGFECGQDISGTTTLDNDLSACSANGLNITSSSVILDCAGNQLTGTTGSGIFIPSTVDNVTIQNCQISGFTHGIQTLSNLTTLTNNTLSNLTYGIALNRSINTTVQNNTITNTTRAIFLERENHNILIRFNNITNNSYAVFFDTGTGITTPNNNTPVNLSYNIIELNTNALIYNSSTKLQAQNNWWGNATCPYVYNITNSWYDQNTDNVLLEPFLNSSSYTANAASCPQIHCGMRINQSKTLTQDLTSCPTIGAYFTTNQSVLDCAGFTISGLAENNSVGIHSGDGLNDLQSTNITNCVLANFTRGVMLGATKSLINNLSITIVEGDSRDGIYTFSPNNTINATTITDANNVNGTGIYTNTRNTTITNNIVHDLYTAMFVSRATLKNNIVLNNTIGYDIGRNTALNAETITNNTVAIEADQTGINISHTIFGTNVFEIIANSTFSNANVTLINSSANRSRWETSSSSNVYNRVYLQVNITNSSQSPLNATSVTVSESTGEIAESILTNASGYYQFDVLTFYTSGNTNYFVTPTTILAQKNNFQKNTTTADLFEKTGAFINISLSELTCGATITGDINISQNYECSQGFSIAADDIIINGNGYALNGEGSGVGINITGYNNITINDLTINNFSTAITFSQANSSQTPRLTIANATTGALFLNAYNNSIKHLNITSTTLAINATSQIPTTNYLLNTTLNASQINTTDNASIELQWAVTINASYNGANPLPFALAKANTSKINYAATNQFTNASGYALLEVSERKINESGTTLISPHNISISYITSSTTLNNRTQINLTQTNNTNVDLSFVIDCTIPESNSEISGATSYCPGEYEVTNISLANNTNLQCDNTALINTGFSNTLFPLTNKHNITVQECTLKPEISSTGVAITLNNAHNITLERINVSIANGIQCQNNSQTLHINNSVFTTQTGITTEECYALTVHNNTFTTTSSQTSIGATLYYINQSTFTNNTFKDLDIGLDLRGGYDTKDVFFYYNNFTDLESNVRQLAIKDYFFNTTVSSFPQGNIWSDYCDQGTDSNDDGFADTGSTGEYPYNISQNGNTNYLDYGPYILTCPSEDVFLGSGGGGGGGSSSSGGSALPTQTSEGASREDDQTYSASEVPDYLSSKVEVNQDDTRTKVTFTLSNNGTKKMFLFPRINQTPIDPHFIVNSKTLLYEGSFLSKIISLAYSQDIISGRLLNAQIIDPEQIVLEPGETLEKTLEIQEGIFPTQVKIEFTTFGEVVKKEEFTSANKAFTGTALDINTQEKFIDLYLVIVPEQAAQTLENYYEEQTNELTGAVTAPPSQEQDTYFMEFFIFKKNKNTNKLYFSELYGPYRIYQTDPLVFAQQIKYDPREYNGDFLVVTKVRKGNKVVSISEKEIKLE